MIEDLLRRVKALEAEQEDMVKIIQKLWFSEGMPGDQHMKDQEDMLNNSQQVLANRMNNLVLMNPNTKK